MAFKPPNSNPTLECLALVIQLMPYYAQYNELLILQELHSKLCDPGKKLHQQMLSDAIVKEQNAISSGDGLRLCQSNFANGIVNGFRQCQNGFTQQNSMFLANTVAKNCTKNIGDEPMPFIWDGGRATGGEGNGGGAMEIGGEGGSNSSHENRQPIEDENDVIIVNEKDRNNNGSMVEGRMNGTNAGGALFLNGIVSNGEQQAHHQSQLLYDPLSKRRADFFREASTFYNNKYRMLSRSVYEFYMKRLKMTSNLDPRLLLKKDLEIRNKFELTIFVENGIPTERLVEKGKEHRKLVAIEEVFDVVHAFHQRIGHGKRMAIYDAIKREYANITLNCVLLYMAGCQYCYSTGDDPTQQQLETRQKGRSQTTEADKKQSEMNRSSSPRKKTIESRAAKLGLNEINYAEHFVIGEDEIRCRHCHFVYFHKSRQRPRHSLRSHLRNYHRKLFNQMAIEQNS